MKKLYIKAPSNVSQHFWHFMMGECLPVLYVVLKHSYTNVHLVKEEHTTTFPLNSFYHEVCASHGIQILISSTPQKGTKYITPLNWDWHNNGEEHKLLWIARHLKRWATKGAPAKKKTSSHVRLCVVQDRQNTSVLDKYYRDTETLPKRKIYGSERRQITNLKNVAQRLQQHYGNAMEVQLLGSETLTLQQQINQYVNANLLVLGHGAGMLHLLWMRPRTCVVEIMPRTKQKNNDGAVQGCKRLCRMLGFLLRRIIVRDVKDTVRVDDVLSCVKVMLHRNDSDTFPSSRRTTPHTQKEHARTTHRDRTSTRRKRRRKRLTVNEPK